MNRRQLALGGSTGNRCLQVEQIGPDFVASKAQASASIEGFLRSAYVWTWNNRTVQVTIQMAAAKKSALALCHDHADIGWNWVV